MKKLLTALCCTASLTTFAQSTPSDKIQSQSKERKNEIGIFTHNNIGNISSTGDVDILGVNYNRWITPNMGYRIIGGYGMYNSLGSVFQKSVVLDTFIDKNIKTHINMAVIGGGLQAQKNVFKKVYLFAAVELRGGYGSGTSDTVTTKSYKDKDFYTSDVLNRIGTSNNMFYLGLSPSVGIKLSGKRLSFGVELYGLNLSYYNISKPGGSTGNFDMGTISQRLFVNFRF
ncbi:MAG: hypothetical protein JST82_10805 [Bacteroidetes bacterium]|nr:hypothetical protein [Bacteroidota bacterium]